MGASDRVCNGRRHAPARDHSWITRDLGGVVHHDAARQLWRIRLADGRELMSTSKTTLESWLDQEGGAA